MGRISDMGVAAESVSFEAGGPADGITAERPVDLVHLARYTLGDRSLEREVLKLFLTQSRIYLSRLESAADDKTWRDTAHAIKGSARGIGAWHVASAAEAVELLKGQALKSDRKKHAIAELGNHIQEVNGYIEALLADN